MMPRIMPARSRPSRAQILAEIRTFVASWFRDGREDGLLADTPLVTSGIVDSAGVLEVVEFLEQRYGIAITDADVSLQNCNTLAALTELVAARIG